MVWTPNLLWWYRYLWIFNNVASFMTGWRELTHHWKERKDSLLIPQLHFQLHLIIAYSFWHWSKFFLACSNLLIVTISASISLSVLKSIPKNTFFLGNKNFLCQFQAITHCLLEILLVSETCQKTFYSVSLQHTSLKDLVGFYIPSAAVVFKFILNIMSCLSGNAN